MAGLNPTILDESVQARFWAKVDRRAPNECWDWQGHIDRHGYGKIKVGSRPVAAHRIALALQNGQIGNLHALHSCDNPSCCNPNHLRWGTPKDNATDKMKRGRCRNGDQSGFNNPRCKITPDALREIVSLIDAGQDNNGQIAARFGIHHAMVSKIRTGNAWVKEVAAIRGERTIPGPVQVAMECLVKHGGQQ